jgi:hypothetical protein
MSHLENISKLFSKNFVENPMLETFEAGKIHLPSGKLVACDPLITHDMKEFVIHFPVGDFPVFVHKERDSNCIAYVEIVFKMRRQQPLKWQLQKVNILKIYKEKKFSGIL